MNIKTIKTLFVSGVIGTLAFLLPLNAATLYVAKEGNDTSAGSVDAPFVTIQKAINVAKEGDVIYVGPGTYSPISLPSSSTKPHITIIGVNGAGETFIDGRGEAQCVNLTRDSYSSSYVAFTNTVIRGFTIRNGYKPGSTGAGVHGGTYINCIVERNVAFYFAAVANALLKNCIIRFNHSEEWINTNPGIPLPPANYYGSICGRSRLENCLIYANESYDGKVLCGDDCEAYNCTIVGNAGRFWDYDKNSCAYNSIIYGNTNATGAVITYAKGVNCYTDDPHFVDFEHGDYRLAGDSPCIDVGNNAYAIGDADLAGNPRIFNGAVDIGAYEWQPETESGTEDIYTETIDGTTWTYVVSNGESTICVPAVGGSAISPAPAGAIKIPAKLGGCPVVEIGDHAMERDWNSTNWNMTAVSFPVTIRRIGENAFANCNKLTAIDIPEGVSDLVIGDRAFLGCALSSLSLPEGVVSIGNQAFSCQLDVDYNFTLSGALVLPESLKSLGWSAFATNNVERVEFKGELPALLNPPEDMSWVTPTYPEAFCANMNWDQTVVYHSTYAESWSNVVQESSQWVNFEEIDDNAQKVVPGFIFAQKSADNYFDTLFPIRENSNGEYELAATNLCASSSPEYTQYAYLTYMRMEGGCRYDFKGHYDDRLFVEVGGQIVLQSVSDCETVNGYYRAPTSGWYLVELRVWNCTGPGGSTEGIKYKPEGDSTWRTFEDSGDGSKFRVEVGGDPLPVINNAPVAIGEYGAEKVGDYRWEFYITEHGAVIESKNWENWRPAVTPAPVGDIVVPRQLNGRTVVGIGNYAFTPDWESEAEMNITSIDIPDTVKSYGDQVFGYGCNFEEFEFKEGVTNLGDYVLMECYNLKRLKIAGTIEKAGYSPFGGGGWYGTSNLEELELGEGLKEIGDYWFNGLYSIYELVIPSTVTNIGSWAFTELAGYSYDGYDYSHPISIVLPQGLKRLGDYAFGYSGGLREIIVPDGVESIGEGVFESCGNLTNVVLGLGVKQVPEYLCYQCPKLKSVEFRSPVSRIDGNAFSGCRNLASFPVATNLTYIGESAFSSCASLTVIDLPEQLSYIGDYAFAYCTGIKTIRVPSGISLNTRSLFVGCSELATVDFPSDLTRIGTEWFRDCQKLRLLNLPESIETVGESAFYNCDAIKTVRLPSNLTQLGQSAFAYCDQLSDVYIPGTLKDVGNYSFSNCKVLTNVTFSSGIEAIGSSAFYECVALKAVDLPDTVKTIREQAFRNCRALARVNLPDGITSLGSMVFAGDTSLTSFRFPTSYTSVPSQTFYDCTSLTNIVLHDAITRIYGSAFYNCSALEHIHLPASLQRIESDAFGFCGSLREIVIPEGVTYIGGMAFRHCRSLESVLLPSGLIEIGGAAFFNCESLREIVIPASVTRLNERQFAGGLYALESVRFMGEPPSVTSWNSTFGEGTASHEFTVYYPVEFSTAWSGPVAEITAMGIKCHAVLPYEGYHAWLSMDRAQYAEGETADVKIHLSNPFEGDVYAYLVPKNEDAFYRCAISGITCLGETNESRTVCLVAGSTEYVVTNGFTFLDGPAEPSFEVLVLTNTFSSTFSTNTIYAVEALNLSVTNVSPEVFLSVASENRIETEIGRAEQIGWVAHDVDADQSEGFTYNWWVNSGWRESGSATNGGFTVTFNDVGEESVRLRVTDKDGGWTDKIIRYWIDPDSYKKVAFDLGEYGKRSGGGALSQLVKVGGDAVPPEVETDPDEDYVFDGWDNAYTNVITNVTIHAVYKYSPVPREFRLSLSSETLPENLTSGIRFVIKRTGTPSKSLEVQLHVDREGVIDIPKSVVIPAGNSSMVLTVRPINNSVVDGRRVVNITCSAEKYTDGEIAITVTDDEVPSVRIELDGEHLREGGAVLVGRVIRDLVTEEPLTVYLSGVSTSRCNYPGSVVIPAGESTVSFEITVVNNDTAEALANMTLRAAAAGYTGDTKSFDVEDDDIPGVRLDIFPEQVSEGAGAKAAYATLTRTDGDKISKAITVRLSAFPANQLILPASITIPAHTLSARFSIGAVDNALDDGDRLVEVTGAVVIESCGCSGQPSSGEAIVSQLTVVDDDGPTLTLKASPSTLREGVDEAGWLTVSHNTSTSEDVTVLLSFDITGEIDIPEEVVIPAGQQSVTVPIRTLDDGIQDGGKLVSIYADDEDDVFAPGSAWVQVSDQNLPDVCLELTTISPNPVVGGSNCRVVFTVANNGVVSYEGAIPYRAYWVGGASASTVQSVPNKSGRIDGVLNVGEVKEVSIEMPVPALPGNYQLVVAVDPDRNIPDLDELNNEVRSDEVSVMPSFTATVDVDQRVYQVGDSIAISGHAVNADGETSAANQKVEIYVIVDGARRSFEATTDAAGDFSLVFKPQTGEMGHYSAGACYPGQNAIVTQVEFDIIGFWRNPNNYVVSDLVVGEHKEHQVAVRNKSSVPLTGVTASVVEQPDGVNIVVSDIDAVLAHSTANLLISIDATAVTEGTEYKYFSIKLESAEGASITIPMAAYVSPTHARLTATPQNVKTTVTVGKPSYLTYTITNDGAGESGRIRIVLPDVSWLRVVSGAVIDNLKSGESAKVLVEATPPVALSLNKLYSGAIGIGCENGQSLSLGLSLIPVSDENGNLKVDVVDTLTLTTQGAPHLSGAKVSIMNPATGAEVAQGETNGDGIFLATDIPAGAYEVSVTADSHNSKRFEMIVAPGDTTGETVYLDYNAVSYSWNVTRTEIEDQYSVDLVMEYDTSVPAPAMKVKAPEEIPALREGESFVCGVEIENCGLIALQDLRLSLGGSIGDYTYEQISPDIELLPAKSSQTIYVKFTNPPKPLQRLTATSNTGITREDIELAQYAPCTVFMQVFARAVCGEEGVDVMMNSNNIRLLGHVCDLMAFTAMQIMKAMGGLGGGGSGSAPRRGDGGSGGDPWGYLNEPPVARETLDCACFIKLVDIALGLGLDRLGLGSLKTLYEEMNEWMETERKIRAAQGGDLDALEDLAESAAKRLRQIKNDIAGQEDAIADVLEKLKKTLELLEDCSRAVGWEKISEAMGRAQEAITAMEDLVDVLSAVVSLCGRTKLKAASNPLLDSPDDIDPAIVREFTEGCVGFDNLLRRLDYNGIADADRFFGDKMEEFRAIREGANALAVCSTVSFQLSQTVTMTREAFEGSLTLHNSGFSGTLTDVKLEPVITDADGNNRTELFGITDRDHSGFVGSSFLEGNLELDGGENGTANVLFVPTVQAALDEPTLYYFGGNLSYFDSVLGETVTHKLIPVPLVVNPCPQLTLDYFVQRDVCGDDPFTADVVEPSEPAELAVMIRNNGKGEAKNTVIKSIQPRILENDKGLVIDFALKDYSLDATALNGSTAHLGLSDVNLGTIGADECAVAQWWLTSSIEGHFTDVSATVTHLNSWGNPDTSLIRDVRIHKLVRSIVADDDTLPDFLTTTDAFGNPEEIYTSKGDIIPIRNDAKCTVDGLLGGESVSITVSTTFMECGWHSLVSTVDGLSGYVIESITRDDGELLPPKNAWITDRVFRNGINPLHRDDLHLVDNVVLTKPTSYVVKLIRKPSEFPEVSHFEETSSGVENSIRDTVTVVFSSPIDPGTFNWMDVSLIAQGEWVSPFAHKGLVTGLQSLTIEPADDSNTKFVIRGLSWWCSSYGRYELTVQCAGIQDDRGNFGRNGKSFSWIFSDSDPAKPCVFRSRSLEGECIYVRFPVPVELDDVSIDSLVLRKNGEAVPLPTSVVVNKLSDCEFAVSGLDDALSGDGDYQLSYGDSDVTSWRVQTQPPAPATNLYITPDEGESDSDGITCASQITVHGTLAPDTPIADVYYVLPGGGPVRILDWGRSGRDISANLELKGGGNVTFIIRSSDTFGNESEASIDAFVDAIPLSVSLQASGEQSEPVKEVVLSFDDDVFEGDVELENFELSRGGQIVPLAGVQLVKSDDRNYALNGLESICRQDGEYRLSYDSTSVRKRLSGLKASPCAPLTWSYKSPDREPPTITRVSFDGEVPECAYSINRLFGEVAVKFSEAVNFNDLDSSGLLGQAFALRFLDVNGSVVSVLPSADVSYDAETFTVSWSINPASMRCGYALVVVDSTLVKDLSGNALACTSDYDVTSGFKSYDHSMLQLSGEGAGQAGFATAYACPTLYDWNGDGKLDLIVGEKYSESIGKLRLYINRGTVTQPFFDDWSYISCGGSEIEFAAAGCVGMQASFGKLPGASMILASSTGDIYAWQHDSGAGMNHLFGHDVDGTDIRFRSIIRTQTFCCDIDGDGFDEVLVSGQNSPMFWMKCGEDEQQVNCTPVQDETGNNLQFPAGQNHTSAVMADVNGDSIKDIVTGDTIGNVWVYLGFSNGSFAKTPIKIFENKESEITRSRLAVGDLDGGGVEEILVGRSDGSILMLKGTPKNSPSVNFIVNPVVTFDLNGHGTRMGGGELSQTVEYGGAAVAPEVAPDYGWNFTGWDKDFGNVTESMVVTAGWSRVKWSVVVNNPDGTAATNLVEHESKIVVTAPEPTVDALCKTQTVYLGSSLTAPEVKSEFEITATAAVTVDWDVLATNYWFAASETVNGEIGAEAGGWKSYGAEFTLTATPAEHYHLANWTGDVGGCADDGNTILVTMDQAREIGAEFAIDEHKVVIGGGLEMTIPSAGAYDYAYGSMVTVTVVNAIFYSGATQFVCQGWSAVNTEPEGGDGTQAVFKVVGDTEIKWMWQTNVLTLAEAVNAPDMAFELDGLAGWMPEWSSDSPDGLHRASICGVPNNSSAYVVTKVNGAGTLHFSWCSRLASRNTKLQFMLDDSAVRMLTGTNGWDSTSVTILDDGEHTLKWRLFTGRTGASVDDFAAFDNVVWEPRLPPSLAEALNTNLVWRTGGDVEWSGAERASLIEEGAAWAQVVGLGDNGTSWISTRVYGTGILSFDWAVSCEEEYDWIEFSVDGEVLGYLDGQTDWVSDAVKISGEGWHEVRWEYVKDIMDDPDLAGANLAMLDHVEWISKDIPATDTPVPVPYPEVERNFKTYLDAANGDHEAAALAIGKNGYAIWECYVAGLDPDIPESKFTAKIEIVNGKPVVTWEPALNGTKADGTCIKEGIRVYQLKGSMDLKNWSIVPDNGEAAFNFFKVEVNLPSLK